MKLIKQLGQHLLEDVETLISIAKASGAAPDAFCLEIGPGTGLLTGRLLDSGARVVAVELDARMVSLLNRKFASEERFTVINNNILWARIDELIPPDARPALAVGNIPYYISTPIVTHLLSYKNLFSRITLLVQREVGMRIAAKPGSSDYGALSVFCSLEAHCENLFNVGKNCFNPPPKVDSCVVALTPKTVPEYEIQDREIFDLIVRGSFEHRRKTCYNSLKMSLEKSFCKGLVAPEAINESIENAFSSIEISKSARPQELDLKTYAGLSNFFSNSGAGVD